jgi:hypothetical protein
VSGRKGSDIKAKTKAKSKAKQKRNNSQSSFLEKREGGERMEERGQNKKAHRNHR